MLNMFQKIKMLCKEQDITFAELERRADIGRGSVARFETNAPSAEKVARVAQCLNVTTDYLLGLSDAPSPNKLDDDTISIQRARQNMSDAEKNRMMNIIKAAFDYAFPEEGDEIYDNKQ